MTPLIVAKLGGSTDDKIFLRLKESDISLVEDFSFKFVSSTNGTSSTFINFLIELEIFSVPLELD